MFHIRDNNARNILFISIAGSAAYVIGKTGFVMSPVILTSMMKGLDLSTTKAGFLLTLELLAVAFSSLLLASVLGRVSKHKAFVSGLSLIVIGQILSAMADTLTLILLGRLLAGIGGGLIVTIANAAISTTADPERIFAIVLVVSGVIIALLLPILTMASDHWAHVGVFLCFATLVFVLAPFCIPILRHQGSSTTRIVIPSTHPPLAYLTLLILLLYFSGASSAWTFAGQIAAQANVDKGMIGAIFSAVTLLGLLGAFLASWLSTRMGRLMPLIGGGLVQVVSIFLYSISTNPIAYTVTLIIAAMSFYFIVPYMLGTAAMFGEHGRWGAAGGAAALLGTALSASLWGILVDWGGYRMLGTAFALVGIVSILTMTFVIVRFKRSTSPSLESSP